MATLADLLSQPFRAIVGVQPDRVGDANEPFVPQKDLIPYANPLHEYYDYELGEHSDGDVVDLGNGYQKVIA